MTTEARKTAVTIARRCDCDHDECDEDFCRVLADAIEAALVEAEERGEANAGLRLQELGQKWHEAEEAREKAEAELSGMYEPASVCTHSRGFDIYNKHGYLIGVYDTGQVVFTATKKGEDGKRVASWKVKVRDDEDEPFWPKIIEKEKEACERAELVAWGLVTGRIKKYIPDWQYEHPEGGCISLGNDPNGPVLTDEAEEALRKARGGA